MVASYAALLLQFKGATLEDVHAARTMIEAPAANMLAQQANRSGAVDMLRRALDEEAEAEDDAALSQAEGRFHRLVVDLTDNRVLIMLSAVANRLIAQQVERLQQSTPARRSTQAGLTEAHRAHGHLVSLIAKGDGDQAEDFWRKHLHAGREYLASGPRAARSVLDLLP
jgi:DNA-binding FadR family transcriptional regulator